MGGYSYDPHSGHLIDSLSDPSGFISVSVCMCISVHAGGKYLLYSLFSNLLPVVILLIANSGLQIKILNVPFIFT